MLFTYEGFLAREDADFLNGALLGFQGFKNFTTGAMIEFSSTYRGERHLTEFTYFGEFRSTSIAMRCSLFVSDVFTAPSGYDWGFNGPKLMNRMLDKWECNITDPTCHGMSSRNRRA